MEGCPHALSHLQKSSMLLITSLQPASRSIDGFLYCRGFASLWSIATYYAFYNPVSEDALYFMTSFLVSCISLSLPRNFKQSNLAQSSDLGAIQHCSLVKASPASLPSSIICNMRSLKMNMWLSKFIQLRGLAATLMLPKRSRVGESMESMSAAAPTRLRKQVQVLQHLTPRYHQLDFFISELHIGDLLSQDITPISSCDDTLRKHCLFLFLFFSPAVVISN